MDQTVHQPQKPSTQIRRAPRNANSYPTNNWTLLPKRLSFQKETEEPGSLAGTLSILVLPASTHLQKPSPCDIQFGQTWIIIFSHEHLHLQMIFPSTTSILNDFPIKTFVYKWGSRQSQSPESVAPSVRVGNPIWQSQSPPSPLNISTGCRETMNGRQKISNKESVSLRKPAGSRNPGENRKSPTKSQSPLEGEFRNPGENRQSTARVSHPYDQETLNKTPTQPKETPSRH